MTSKLKKCAHTSLLVRKHAHEHVSWSTHLCVNMAFEIKHKKFCDMLHTDTSSYVTICNGDALVSQKKINMTSSLQIVAPWWDGIFDKTTLEAGWHSTNKEISGYSSGQVRVEGKNLYHVAATDRHAIVSDVVEQTWIRRRSRIPCVVVEKLWCVDAKA